MAAKRNRGGAPRGSRNAADGKLWRAAIRRALDKRTEGCKPMKDALDELAELFLKKCEEGDVSAFRELGDRLDGKAVQAIAGVADEPLIIEIVRMGGD